MIDDTIKTAIDSQEMENYDDNNIDDDQPDDDDEAIGVEEEPGDNRDDEADGDF